MASRSALTDCSYKLLEAIQRLLGRWVLCLYFPPLLLIAFTGEARHSMYDSKETKGVSVRGGGTVTARSPATSASSSAAAVKSVAERFPILARYPGRGA
ncbi:hypothetical protein KCP74_15765 [Salmonella enterica subsp. enterica]|nr:hypothetical protein KCP74_15765 [Salmonella enterica subsp. enterica]